MEMGRHPAQIIRRQGKTAIWSRGDELISGAFPELMQAGNGLPDGTVIDGEIVAWDERSAAAPLRVTAAAVESQKCRAELLAGCAGDVCCI